MKQKRIKNIKYLSLSAIALLSVVLFFGCLGFGKDEETINPTLQQVSKCRELMHLNPSLDITPLGYKLLASGIDDAIWFKFRADTVSLNEIFNLSTIAKEFSEGFVLIPEKGLNWWDVVNKNFIGGQVSLPNSKFMNVGIEKEMDGLIIYIFWFET